METIELPVDYARAKVETPHVPCILTSYVLKPQNGMTGFRRPAVIICPGGGFHCLVERESFPVVHEFLERGISAYLLSYTVKPNGYFPASLVEAFSAVSFVRLHASENNIDPDRIALIGFSAGGHLAASAGVFWNHPFAEEWGFSSDLHRPDSLILGYPVISGGQYAHPGSFENLLGLQDSPYWRQFLSLEQQVNPDTPRTYIWHTETDPIVPVQNTLRFASSLIRQGVETELHIFPRGGHGLSTARPEALPADHISPDPFVLASVSSWVGEAVRFLQG